MMSNRLARRIGVCCIGLLTLLVSQRAGAEESWCTRVAHAPLQPKPGEAVKVTASVAAGVTGVTLLYQIVEPGAYVEWKDAAYQKQWESLTMQAGETKDGRVMFTANLPATLQKHRRLVRYRITAKNAAGEEVISPMMPPIPFTSARPGEKPPAPAPGNYAYFVYGSIPPWKGAIEPQSKDPARSRPVVFPAETMNRIRPYHLLGKKTSIENATWNEQPGGKDYKYTGTLVVDGVVHDHVRFRARGGVWRYALGKNMWKLDLAPGDRLQAKDDWGRNLPSTWAKVNLRCIIQLGDYGRRGEQGMYESVGFRLFNLAGVPACNTAWVQLRIIDQPDESPADQYQGDFWGLYLAIENEDGRFLKAHNLPDGNLFKMAGGGGELNHQAEGQPADGSDLSAFLNACNSAEQSEEWWRAHLDLPSYYSYRAIVECIHHYDIGEGKNYDYYHNPKTGKWQVVPWDLDLTWADHMYGNGEEPFKGRVLAHPALRLEYQNRLREIRDLLFNPEQAGALIDEYAAVLVAPGDKRPSIAEADRRKWDYHPALARGGQAGQGRFYQASEKKNFAGMVEQMKQYVKTRGAWIDANLLNDPKIPATPRLTYTGPASHPAAQLRFASSPYQGAAPFAAVEYRLAEVTPAAAKKTPRTYEITPAWQSDELAKVEPVTLPPNVAKAGHTYRARVRMKDNTGRWSHWSPPLEFVAR
jgi:hypothetical protein